MTRILYGTVHNERGAIQNITYMYTWYTYFMYSWSSDQFMLSI